jgi:uncharacterized protein (DUF2267 family)
MRQDEMVAAVRASAGIDSRERAEKAVRSTLGVLGRRLAGGETSHVASQLPAGLAQMLPVEGPGERFGMAEFYDRVAVDEGGGCTPEQARQHARAVAAALKVQLTGGEFDQLAAQLPPDYADLLGTEPVQHH